MPSITKFVHEQWPVHLASLGHDDVIQFSHVTQLRVLLEDLVVHYEDHHPAKFCVFCPVFYFTVLEDMWHNQEVFGKISTPPTHMRHVLNAMVPDVIRQSYPWSFDLTLPIPYGYGLLKGQKSYKKARPVISYSSCTFGNLLQAIGRILTDLLQKVFPHTLGNLTIQDVFKKLHQYLDSDPEFETSELHNDDLVGFFVSVPHDLSLIHI